MIKSVLTVALSILAVSSAQLANAPERVRNSNNIVKSSSGSAFGRSNNLRSNMKQQRDLQTASMSMIEEVVAPTSTS